MKFETMYLYKILTVLFHVLIIKISSDKYNIIMLLSLCIIYLLCLIFQFYFILLNLSSANHL